MDEIDRLTILENIDKLISATDYELLKEKCQNAKLLSSIMVNNIEQDCKDIIERHRALLKKIVHRGPNAFLVFKGICETDFKDAFEILKLRPTGKQECLSIAASKKENERRLREMQEGNTANSKPTTSRPKVTQSNIDANKNAENSLLFQEYSGELHNVIQVKKAVKYGTSSIDEIETYNMQDRHRGVLFLINIIDFETGKEKRRNGAEVDKHRLLDLFRQFGFKLFYFENTTSSEFKILLKKLISTDHLRLANCLVFGILTHGCLSNYTTYIEFADGGYYAVEEIVEEFSNSNCKYLQGKPKIFIFPFCRGEKRDKGTEVIIKKLKPNIEHDSSDIIEIKRIGSYSDIAICYATVPGFRTHRDPEDGSWYVQGLCNVFANHAHNRAFEDLMKLVDLEVSKMDSDGAVQTASVDYRGFNKVLYFNPGYYGEESNNNYNNNS